jgi:hypothetical protein
MKTFEEAWAEKEVEGYQYGEDALQGVHFGWEIAMKAVAEDDGSLPFKIDDERCSKDPDYLAAVALYVRSSMPDPADLVPLIKRAREEGHVDGLLRALQLAESQVVGGTTGEHPQEMFKGDEYRRGQYRGALDAVTMIQRELKYLANQPAPIPLPGQIQVGPAEWVGSMPVRTDLEVQPLQGSTIAEVEFETHGSLALRVFASNHSKVDNLLHASDKLWVGAWVLVRGRTGWFHTELEAYDKGWAVHVGAKNRRLEVTVDEKRNLWVVKELV